MTADAVVERLDVLEEACSRLVVRGVFLVVDQFPLEIAVAG